jgi:hypothetical protein
MQIENITTAGGTSAAEGILDGDFKGHPFRGNAHRKASHESSAAVGSSMRAKHAERKGDAKGATKAHASAHYSHKAAAVSASGKAQKYHNKMAEFHGGRAGLKVMDAVLDAAGDEGFEYVSGVISKDGAVAGRAYIGGDGKAMVYAGVEGLERVTYVSVMSGERQSAMWSDDDAADMVGYLFAPAQEVVTDPVPGSQPVSADLVAAGSEPHQTDPAPLDPESVTVPAENDATRLNAIERAAPKGAITSDDPQAIEKLQAKLAALLARQEFMKKANKFFKAKNEAELLAMGLTQDMIDKMKRGDFAGRIGFADYLLTNNNGVISTTRKRLESMMADQLKQQQAESAANIPAPVDNDVSSLNAGEVSLEFKDGQPGKWVASDESGDLPPVFVPLINSKTQEPPVPESNPAKEADTAYLQTLIDGSADMFAADILERLEPMFTQYETDATMMGLLNQAAEAYSAAAVKAAQTALAG